MLTIYDAADGVLIKREGSASISPATVWIDLFNPTKDEDLQVEQALAISVPTREEMSEIEASSRIYQEGGGYFMTAIVLHQPDMLHELPPLARLSPSSSRAALIRALRGASRSIFLTARRRRTPPARRRRGAAGLLEAIIDREADRSSARRNRVDSSRRSRREAGASQPPRAALDNLSRAIFGAKSGGRRRVLRFDVTIKMIGREGELTSRSRECLLTLDRLTTYLAHVMSERGDEKALRARVKTASRDVQSLAHHLGYLSTKITFLLDATLGMINNEQNSIIKIFSVLAVALMPPTLVGTVYGMNFKHMPELEWLWGYPWALALMVLSAGAAVALLQAQGLAVGPRAAIGRHFRERAVACSGSNVQNRTIERVGGTLDVVG
jgi:magnesium transporter